LGKGGTMDFQVRPWGIRRTRKSVVPLKQQAGKRGIAVGASLTRRIAVGWHELARESKGETPHVYPHFRARQTRNPNGFT